ncbi:hypothetical protein ACLB2K_055811 [Fragaria x ananassa]
MRLRNTPSSTELKISGTLVILKHLVKHLPSFTIGIPDSYKIVNQLSCNSCRARHHITKLHQSEVCSNLKRVP